MKQIKLLVAVLLAVSITACSTAPKITSGSVVKVEYKGTLKDGTVFDSTDGKAPLSFLMGSGQVLPKFEENIAKISTGKSSKFTLKAEDAYGVTDPAKIVKIPRDERFKGVDLKEGVVIFANNKLASGEIKQTPMKVVGVSDTEVTMDYNHPLAGQDLTFEVKIIDVTAPQSAAPAAEETQEEAQSEA